MLGLVASGYLAVAGSGFLDTPTIALTGAGLVLRGLLISGLLRLGLPERAATLVTLGYAGFFPLGSIHGCIDFKPSDDCDFGFSQ